jgi:hypothetical protein
VKCGVEKLPTIMDTLLSVLWYDHLSTTGQKNHQEVVTAKEVSHDSTNVALMKLIVA